MGTVEILELRKKSGMIVFSLMALMVILMILPFASAQPILISVVRSDACERSVSCLPVSALSPLDTSDQRISGKLSDFSRDKPMYKNHYQLYQFKKDQYVVCVECDGIFQDHSRIIIIETLSEFKYIKQSDHVISNNTFYDYSNRTISEGCRTATISSDLALLKDTIYVMGNDCKVPSKYTEQTKTVKPYTKLNICSYACEYQKFLKDAKEKSKKTFLTNPGIKLKNQNEKVRVR